MRSSNCNQSCALQKNYQIESPNICLERIKKFVNVCFTGMLSCSVYSTLTSKFDSRLSFFKLDSRRPLRYLIVSSQTTSGSDLKLRLQVRNKIVLYLTFLLMIREQNRVCIKRLWIEDILSHTKVLTMFSVKCLCFSTPTCDTSIS